MKTGNTFTQHGRSIGLHRRGGAVGMNWENPYIIRKPKRTKKAQSTAKRNTKNAPKGKHIPESESVDYKKDMKYSRYAGSDFGALGEY